MIIKQRWGFTLALILAVGPSAQAADETVVVERAVALLEEISSNPESGIPPRFLREARGIMIMPHIVENHLGVGRKKGHGVLLRRNENGGWGDPEPIEISGVSVGAEAGREVTDLVLIYRTRKAADQYAEQTLSLGLSFDVLESLGHTHKFSGPRPDSKIKDDILVYKSNRGLLVGATIRGERKWVPTLAPLGLKTTPTAGRKAAGAAGKVPAKVTKPVASAPSAKTGLDVDSPEVVRLKAVLTAMTIPPPAQNPEKGMRDPKVHPTGGAKPPAATTAAPR